MSLWQIIKEDFNEPKRQDPAFNSQIEVFFNYPGVWALINHRIAHFLYKKGYKKIARILSGLTQLITKVDIHPAAKIGRNVFIDHATGLVIGETAQIGNNVLLYQNVTLGGVSLNKGQKRHPTLKDGVVIGAGAKILGDIIIGENSKIGANSVVVKDVPPNSTAVGIPARIIGECHEPLEHNKIPDVNKELFLYLSKKIKFLENLAIKQGEILDQDKKLDEIYEKYLKSLEN